MFSPNPFTGIDNIIQIHEFMTGRIKILDNNDQPLVPSNLPLIPYEYDVPGVVDRMCNTFGLDAWLLSNPTCPNEFVCNAQNATSQAHADFGACIQAMNCKMVAGMTTNIGDNEMALFNYHMIPHHENGTFMVAFRTRLIPTYPRATNTSDQHGESSVAQSSVRRSRERSRCELYHANFGARHHSNTEFTDPNDAGCE